MEFENRARFELEFKARTDKLGPCIKQELGPCWIWLGSLNKDGYGEVNLYGKHLLAHRLSVKLYHDSFEEKLYVLHKCDNPSCVNPAHLFQGTAKDNFYDAVSKGRIDPVKWQRAAPRKVFPEHENRIVELCKQGVKHSEIAKEIGVAREVVSKYARKHGFRKNFNEEEVLEMKRLHESGLNYRQIADIFDREQSSIRKAISRL